MPPQNSTPFDQVIKIRRGALRKSQVSAVSLEVSQPGPGMFRSCHKLTAKALAGGGQSLAVLHKSSELRNAKMRVSRIMETKS